MVSPMCKSNPTEFGMSQTPYFNSVIRLSLGRRLVNLSPVAHRTNALTDFELAGYLFAAVKIRNCCMESYTPAPVDVALIPHLSLLCKLPEFLLVLNSSDTPSIEVDTTEQ